MTMGQRIRQARLEAGLSQRQLAGEEFTRNMLSVLENDGANPSVATLKYLSVKLCKPIGFFLGEEAPGVPEAAQMEQARLAYRAGEYRLCLQTLEGLEAAEFQPERKLLEALAAMELAREAIGKGRFPYAGQMLARSRAAGADCPYFGPELERKWSILAARAERKAGRRAALAAEIEMEDEVLCLKAQAALTEGNYDRAGQLLDAAEDRRSGQWSWLRGEVYFKKKEYAAAAECYHRAEADRPRETGKRLEICYREMEDFKMAYYYATKK